MDHLEREDPPILIVEGFYPVSWEIPQADKPPPHVYRAFYFFIYEKSVRDRQMLKGSLCYERDKKNQKRNQVEIEATENRKL